MARLDGTCLIIAGAPQGIGARASMAEGTAAPTHGTGMPIELTLRLPDQRVSLRWSTDLFTHGVRLAARAVDPRLQCFRHGRAEPAELIILTADGNSVFPQLGQLPGVERLEHGG